MAGISGPDASEARAALVHTRPWVYFLGVVSVMLVLLCLILVLAGILGLGADRARASLMITAGVVGAAAATVLAVFQLGYAGALSEVERVGEQMLEEAIELACRRQRSLWVATAVITVLGTLGELARTIAALIGAPG